MTGFASVITPFSWSPAIQLSNTTWRKRVLPVGDIEYQGRQLHFTPSYLAGLVRAWQARAYDAVPLQFADDANRHTNDPERTRGWITGMELADDGLWVTAEMSERGSRVLADNPQLGVSARIVEQYQRSDGKFFPAAIQHVLATLDPRIPGLGAWSPVDMASGGGLVIDLSSARWAGEAGGDLSEHELADYLQAVAEADAELGSADGPELTDDELAELMAVLDGEPEPGPDPAFTEFDAAFNARAQADQAREDARAAAYVEDLMHPARRDEDRLARLMSRAAEGVYDSPPEYAMANERAAIELAVQSGQGMCGLPDAMGRCGSRWHSLDCQHQQTVDWLASGPPRSTYAASLANAASGFDLSGDRVAIWDDPDGDDDVPALIPQATLELAHQLASDWGLADDAPGAPDVTAAMDLLRPEAGMSAYDTLAAGISAPLRDGVPSLPGYPGISDLARDLGLK